MAYYNTVNQEGENLKKAISKTESQKKIVLAYFDKYRKLTVGICFGYYKQDHDRNILKVSIGRAFTDLLNEGKIIKTEYKREGLYGSPEHYYIRNL